ncbi:MAG: hypothetical protein M3O28_06785 [Actinomycetota bacterium]|nr:hypothetical protein [Actinomycetota bacterium]
MRGRPVDRFADLRIPARSGTIRAARLEGLAALLHEKARFSMPPEPGVWAGKDAVVACWADGGFGSDAFGSVRCVTTRANGQPAVAVYVRLPGGLVYEPVTLEVLRF